MNEEKKHGYWISHTKQDSKFVTGYRILPDADCSQCGKTVHIKKDVCPYCGAIMDEKDTIYVYNEEE